jgi:regulator of sigma E protease
MTQNIGTNLLAVVIVLGFLIFIHEAGHFLLAKLFRVRVLVFSFGFGKRLFGFRKGGTDYRVSLVPLGGYVRMAGDNPEENLAGNPDEFLSKPKWQRFLILFAGPAMNIVIALLFMAFVAMIGFEERITKPIVAQVEKGMPAEKSGLQPGDRLVRIKNEPVNDYNDARLLISMNAGTPLPAARRCRSSSSATACSRRPRSRPPRKRATSARSAAPESFSPPSPSSDAWSRIHPPPAQVCAPATAS